MPDKQCRNLNTDFYHQAVSTAGKDFPAGLEAIALHRGNQFPSYRI